MRTTIICASLVLGCLLVFTVATIGTAQNPNRDDPKQLTSNQALMRDKLKHMNRVLEGITLNKFNEVEEAAKYLGMISRATSWHISDPTPRYNQLSKNFQEQATDLERHAKEHNVDAATLDLVRMNVTCTQCHEHMRESNPQGK